MPVALGALVMLLVALIVNNMPSTRRYPEFWMQASGRSFFQQTVEKTFLFGGRKAEMAADVRLQFILAYVTALNDDLLTDHDRRSHRLVKGEVLVGLIL